MDALTGGFQFTRRVCNVQRRVQCVANYSEAAYEPHNICTKNWATKCVTQLLTGASFAGRRLETGHAAGKQLGQGRRQSGRRSETLAPQGPRRHVTRAHLGGFIRPSGISGSFVNLSRTPASAPCELNNNNKKSLRTSFAWRK